MKIKKYTFLEALAIAGMKRAIIDTVENDRHFYREDSTCAYLEYEKTSNHWWPNSEKQKERIWEVEPEDIFVYGACDKDGVSCIYGREPIRHLLSWGSAGGEHYIDEEVLRNNLFPKDKPQKYKLMPVDESKTELSKKENQE